MTLPDSAPARAEILSRVRSALSTRERHDTSVSHAADDAPGIPPTPPRHTHAPSPARSEVVDRFVERVEDYRAIVRTCAADELAEHIASALSGVDSVVVPCGFEPSLTTAISARVVHEIDVSDVHDVEGVGAVVTLSSISIAETGTVVLGHSAGQGRRGLSLLPDLHVCVVRTDQIVPGVPDAVASLRASIYAGRPLTWISGPSATSDIELVRVEGVHGPRTLCVILVTA